MTNFVNLATVKPTALLSAGGIANFSEEEIMRRNTANSKRAIKIIIKQIRQWTKKNEEEEHQ